MEVSKSDLKDGALKIAAFDDEKYANDSELGEVTIPLREISFGRNGEENNTTRDFLEPKKVNKIIKSITSEQKLE